MCVWTKSGRNLLLVQCVILEHQDYHTSALHQDFTAPNFSLSIISGSMTDQDLNGLDDAIVNALFTTAAPATPSISSLIIELCTNPFPLRLQHSWMLGKDKAWDVETPLRRSFLCCNDVEYNLAGFSRFNDTHDTELFQNRSDTLLTRIFPERSDYQQ